MLGGVGGEVVHVWDMRRLIFGGEGGMRKDFSRAMSNIFDIL